MTSARYTASVGLALWQRALMEVSRVRGGLFPATIAPMIFLFGTSGQFDRLSGLPGFPADNYLSWIVPLSCIQAAGFAGGAVGANLARDIEQGWFDRLLTSPAPRPMLLVGPTLAAMTRALAPATIILTAGLIAGARLTGGIPGLLALYVGVVWMCGVAALWGCALALWTGTQQVGPLIQNGVFISIFLTTAYTPQPLLTGWLATFAAYNPVTYVLEMVRQATVSGIEPSWANTWPGLLALLGMTIVLGWFALNRLRRIGR